MSIYIGDKEIKNLYIGDSSAKEVYLGDTKVRPSISLKSCEEIIAMATAEGYPRTNTLVELNSNGTDYYNQLYNCGKCPFSDSEGCSPTNGTGGIVGDNGKYIKSGKYIIIYNADYPDGSKWYSGRAIC